jgi:PAS domain S-box-containing protein
MIDPKKKGLTLSQQSLLALGLSCLFQVLLLVQCVFISNGWPRFFLVCTSLLNLAVLAGMAIWYRKAITIRLSGIEDNLLRFTYDEELYPKLEGADEIAKLDNSFHDMVLSLQRARKNLRALIDNMLVGLVAISSDGKIESVNNRIERLFNTQGKWLLNKQFDSLFPESMHLNMNTLIEISLGKVAEIEAVRVTGETFPVELSLSQFRTDKGLTYLAIILDVSERHEVEKLKRAFVATVTHELRTPLTSIKGSLHLIKQGRFGELPEKVVGLVDVAERNTVRLMALINDILDIEKLESGRLQMEFANVALNTVLERAAESVRSFADQAGVHLDFQDTRHFVYADADRLVQVVVNLVSNAVKFSPKEQTVSIRAVVSLDCVQVLVIDRGRGVPEKYKEMIFERFQQVEDADQRKKGGTGLGLAICKQIIEQHGGTIGVDSEPNQGSTFWFKVSGPK